MRPRLLFADDRGVVYDHPVLLAAARSGDDLVAPRERPVPLPDGAVLTFLPGRRPVGMDPSDGSLVVLGEVRVGRRRIVPHAVGATLPPGFTRTLLPAAARPALATVGTTPILPQWAYTA
ncbi:MAG TPA: radical SAM protein, partial [Anaeromyxobacter sp.]